MDLRTVADELYAVAPGDFVAERAAAAKEADRALAKQIKALRKPSAAAAAINALVRERGEVIQDLLDVGDRMREAFAERDRDAIRELTQQRQRVLQRAIKGLDVSPSVQREVEETLQAAVIDPAAAAAVRSGLLVRALESTGVDQVDIEDAVAVPIEVEGAEESEVDEGGAETTPATEKPGARTKASAKAEATAASKSQRGRTRAPEPEPEPEPEPAESAGERRERQRRLRAAEKAVERAREDADELDDELDEEVDRRSDLEAERDSLERRLQRVTDELADSKSAERDLRKRVAAAQSALRDAQRSLQALRDDD